MRFRKASRGLRISITRLYQVQVPMQAEGPEHPLRPRVGLRLPLSFGASLTQRKPSRLAHRSSRANFGTKLIIKPTIYWRIAINMRRGTVCLSNALGRVMIGT